ncbi:AAA family ATPase [aff. Roholtiella sp. LEGE 12411]|uniref:AAA family ATPase n=1 Tax=aff. Roholtiella sp. LEGE 12411 TaxID=1828822 RepID=UPI001882FE21|nr:ATP-binding protein [aff. Roholtiella sp. LEGE 12411]MBE9036149.1 AAA family ATPase [aff. Roholtiella sp. LEGE 12411]
MLKQLILENWKSFRYAELPLDPLTVLIGTNASGKSNVVEALEFIQRIVKGEDIEAALAGDKNLTSIRGGVEGAALKPGTQFTLKALVQGQDDKTDYLYSITIQTKPFIQVLEEYVTRKNNTNNYKQINFPNYLFRFALGSNGIISMSAIFTNENTKIPVTRNFTLRGSMLTDLKIIKFSDSISNEINTVINSIENIFSLNPIISKMRDYSRLSESLETDTSNLAGVLAALPDEQKAEVESTLSDYIKDLPEGDIQRVWAEKVGRFGTDAMLYCVEEWKPGHITEIDARSMSDGTLRFLAILTALLTRSEGSQLVIEEIDNGLHPSRAELLVRILREIGSKRKIDILITTHNPALLDALGSEIVPFVVVAHRDSETGESKLTLLEDIDNFSKLFASYSLGDMTTKGAIERSLSRGN